MGLKGVDLVRPEHFATLKRYGLIGTMTLTHPIPKGLNRKENHEECLAKIRAAIDATADAGFPNVICFSGNRDGMDDEEGLKICANAVKQVAGLCEQKNITLCMELLNSKRDHKDYMCDRTDWGARLVKDIIEDLARHGRTIVLSTHILEIAQALCHRIAIIDRGRITAVGSMSELRRQAGATAANLEDVFLRLTAEAEAEPSGVPEASA